MHTLTIPEMQQFIVHVGFHAGEPVMLWGPPGVGKSEGVRGAVILLLTSAGIKPEQVLNAECTVNGCDRLVDIRLSQYDSVDLRGIPTPREDGLTVWHAPSTLPFKGNPAFKEDDVPITLFLDEINAAAPSVAAVAYQLINDRRVGEHRLMDNVVVIAAGNREGDRGVTNRMPTPLANRFTHAEVGVDVDAWCAWAQDKQVDPMVIAFLQYRKPLLNNFKADQAVKDKAFATPRTWFKAARYYTSDMPGDTKRAAIQGAIGEGPANEFWGFVDVCKDMPSMQAIEKDPMGVPMPEQASIRYATAVAVSGTMDKDNIAAFNTFLGRMDPEFSILAWSLAMKRDRTLTATKQFIEFSKKYREVLTR